QPRMKNVLYDVISLEDRFLILTNWDALNFRLMECAIGNTSKENWKEVIPHRTDVLLSGVEEFKDFLVISEREKGLVNLRIVNRSDNNTHFLDFGEPAYVASVTNNLEYNVKTLRYAYSSLVTPASIYDYNMVNKSRKLMKQQEVIGGYDTSAYKTERLYATAIDGTIVPVSIVYKKGFKKDGNSPLLLYAYGSYGRSEERRVGT